MEAPLSSGARLGRWGHRTERDHGSYRNFALGTLEDPRSNTGGKLIRLAATELIDNFEAVLRDYFEGFPLPSLIDRIIISAGLSSAVKEGNPDSLNLMVRGSEVLARNLRHSLVDVAAVLGSQPNEVSRRNAHAYVHLLDKKREWEFEQITKLLAKDPKGTKAL